jgi:hypothetical protein
MKALKHGSGGWGREFQDPGSQCALEGGDWSAHIHVLFSSESSMCYSLQH